ncbi:energy transducer TonB [Roseovarius sp. M141]|uniref:energy transducer TonB family protein n=1 Tax=Roseovarius sp. M141 TaxID=2583806 RepID=UPI0020CE5B94|nr:energy transducer TonB [Roseovarius sp. M141]MCQ0091547.1 TonB family protein [Roseovarius sp. M141]
MIAASRSLWVLALAVALAVHAVLGWALMARQEVAIESGAGAQDVQVGTSFADMAVGTLEATETTDMTEVLEPQPPERAQPVQPEPAERVEATPAQPTQTPAEVPRAVEQIADDAVPTIAAPLAQTEAVTPEMAQEVIEADDTAEPAVARSLRPKPRSEAFEKKNEQTAQKAAQKQPKKKREPAKQPRGNAKQAHKAGAASGNSRAAATAAGVAHGSSAASGNAAASNYPGLVMRRVSRVPRPRTGSRGTAVVAFSISGAGGLAGASIARSSGSAALDRAALRMIRSAAPFPPPPPGAQRNFSINIEGR